MGRIEDRGEGSTWNYIVILVFGFELVLDVPWRRIEERARRDAVRTDSSSLVSSRVQHRSDRPSSASLVNDRRWNKRQQVGGKVAKVERAVNRLFKMFMGGYWGIL